MAAADDGDGPVSPLFTYGVPFVGVLVLAVGIAAAVPGAYALIQEEITECGSPTIAVEGSETTAERFGDTPPVALDSIALAELSPADRAAVEAALAAPRGEARVRGPVPHAATFRDGVIVTDDGERYYATLVAENPCFAAEPLQFPLGVFAIALGVVGILTPPAYRRLVALETG